MSDTSAISLDYGRPADATAPRRRLMRRGLKVGTSLADQAACSATNFLTGVLVSRSVTEAEFGLYGTALATLLIITEAHNALISTPHQVLSPRLHGGDLRRFNGSNLLGSLSLGGVSLIGLLAASTVVWLLGDEHFGQTMLALAIAMWAILARQFARQFSFAMHRPAMALLVDAIMAVVQLGTLFVLFRNGQLGPVSAVIVIGVANAIAVGVFLLLDRRRFAPRPVDARRDFAATWPMAKWLVFSGVLWTLGMHGYPPLIFGVAGKEQAGIWTACFGIAALANPLLMGIQNIVGPAVAHAYTAHTVEGFRRYVLRITAGFGGLVLPFAIVVSIFGELLVSIYGPQYTGYGAIVGILAFSTLTHAIGFPSARGLMAIHQTRHDLIGNVITLAVMLSAGIALIAMYGVLGAALSFVISEVLGNGYRVAAFLWLTRRGTIVDGEDMESAEVAKLVAALRTEPVQAKEVA
ncbi:MAG: polysaccharide biosynthesis C-terminal domain-containing protein [Planctomycetota bacterium]